MYWEPPFEAPSPQGVVEEMSHELPLTFNLDDNRAEEIVDAASERGFFQVVIHGIPEKVLPNHFEPRLDCAFLVCLSGNPKPTRIHPFFRYETLHVSFSDVSTIDQCMKQVYEINNR